MSEIFIFINSNNIYFRFDLPCSNLDNNIRKYSRKELENKLQIHFGDKISSYTAFKQHPLPNKREYRIRREENFNIEYSQFNDVDIVFLAGGTCRIPFVQKWIKEQFPNAEMIMGGELEIITATGAAIHALQVLSGEVEPYIKIIQDKNNELDLKNKQLNVELEELNKSNDDINSDKTSVTKDDQAPTNSEASQYQCNVTLEPPQDTVFKKEYLR